ncbi:MAG: 1-(5-phosphoribosyl)-5-[(5-phosphoribosylamino)methylideneamino]imidazole-4-carboxamide isomerase [Chloroflexi bacterium]|nr:1-(5-phosphoribosyl)-5-[(5-phosphoribosylamino)methylideneamino]imidazole-4-carboxamide isomerase [Chloroflexota bacterium]
MIVYPAIDLRQGRCVRLCQGQPQAETVYAEDPVAVACRWAQEGAAWLHVVDLDGAFGRIRGLEQTPEALGVNWRALGRIARAVNVPIQFGGGLRTLEDIEKALALGAARVVLGTVAITNPELIGRVLARFGRERIVVSLDARHGRVAVYGWQETRPLDVLEAGRRMAALGVARVVYTDISRDGMLSGVDAAAAALMARETGLSVIASGGVASLEDVRRLKAREPEGVEGVIIGRALYTGAVRLWEAMAIAKGESDAG